MNAKFQFKRVQNQTVMDDVTKARRTNLLQALPDGEYEIIIRKAVKWDVARMRKYFHGPVLAFIRQQFKSVGTVICGPDLKEFLKKQFGPTRLLNPSGKREHTFTAFKSTSEYDFETYKNFLNDINAWCIECFGYELPPSDEVE